MENACASWTDVHWIWLPCDLWKIFLHSAPLNSPITTLSHCFWLPNFIHTLWGTFRHKWHANTNKAHGYTLFILYLSFPHVHFFHCWELGREGVLSLKNNVEQPKMQELSVYLVVSVVVCLLLWWNGNYCQERSCLHHDVRYHEAAENVSFQGLIFPVGRPVVQLWWTFA